MNSYGASVTRRRHDWPVLLPTTCPVCGAPGPSPCLECRGALRPAPDLPPPEGLVSCPALLSYEGVGRELVARLKYRNARSSLPWLAAQLAQVAPGPVDAVTWVPTTGRRRRRRGFDQSALLARAVARRLSVPSRAMLRRLPGPHQTGRSRSERLAGPALGLRRGVRVPARVLLVDDVATTGASLSTAARWLKEAGAREVHAVVIARRR